MKNIILILTLITSVVANAKVLSQDCPKLNAGNYKCDYKQWLSGNLYKDISGTPVSVANTSNNGVSGLNMAGISNQDSFNFLCTSGATTASSGGYVYQLSYDTTGNSITKVGDSVVDHYTQRLIVADPQNFTVTGEGYAKSNGGAYTIQMNCSL